MRNRTRALHAVKRVATLTRPEHVTVLLIQANRSGGSIRFSRPPPLKAELVVGSLAMANIEACVDCNPDQQSAPPVSVEPTTTPAHSNSLDPTTFVPPSPSIFPSITIEFCDRVTIFSGNTLMKHSEEPSCSVDGALCVDLCKAEKAAPLNLHRSFTRLHRATWTSTELFLTFPTPAIRAINIIPLNAEDTAGRFRVWLFLDGRLPVLVWDRKVEGGFPELKVLVRDNRFQLVLSPV